MHHSVTRAHFILKVQDRVWGGGGEGHFVDSIFAEDQAITRSKGLSAVHRKQNNRNGRNDS